MAVMGVGNHSIGRHAAGRRTETHKEQVNRLESWTGSQPTPPKRRDEPHAPGEEALSPVDWNRHKQNSHVTKW
jgi:hypothetical protein